MTMYTPPSLTNLNANAYVSGAAVYVDSPLPGRMSQVPLPTWLMDKKWTVPLDGSYVPKAAYELEKNPTSGWETMIFNSRQPVMPSYRGPKSWRMVCVQYGNDQMMQIPYMRVFIEEIASGKSKGKPFKRMKEMWSELHGLGKSKSCFTVDDCGRMHDSLGRTLKDNVDWDARDRDLLEGIFDVAVALEKMYLSWRMFPNEKKMKDVDALVEAVDRVERMRHGSTVLESRIEDARAAIRETQNDIEKMQGELNKMYEDSADAMNLLEEHGVDPNKILDDSYSPSICNVCDEHMYSFPYISVDRSMTSTCCTSNSSGTSDNCLGGF